jgi:hypothetical protein
MLASCFPAKILLMFVILWKYSVPHEIWHCKELLPNCIYLMYQTVLRSVNSWTQKKFPSKCISVSTDSQRIQLGLIQLKLLLPGLPLAIVLTYLFISRASYIFLSIFCMFSGLLTFQYRCSNNILWHSKDDIFVCARGRKDHIAQKALFPPNIGKIVIFPLHIKPHLNQRLMFYISALYSNNTLSFFNILRHQCFTNVN